MPPLVAAPPRRASAPPPAVGGRGSRRHGSMAGRPLLWLLPSLILIAVVFVYPITQIIRLSFTDAGLVGGVSRYTIDSYRSLARGDLGQILWVTFVFVALSIVFQMLLGFLIALLIDESGRRGLIGVGVTRTLVMTAWAIPGVVIGIIWKLMYQESDSGILNYLFSLVGFSGNTPFLSNPHIALLSVTFANVWRGTALSMILCFAGLKTIPRDALEAAHIDGASAFSTLWRIILPLMRPVLIVNLTIVTIQTLNTFDMMQALTGGGPGRSTEVLALGVYNEIFGQQALGRGAAIGVALMVINMVVVFAYLRFLQRGEERA